MATADVYSVAGSDAAFARQAPPFVPTGSRYWSGLPTAYGPANSVAWGGSRMLAYPITIPHDGTIDRIGLYVLTGAAGAAVDVGIYQRGTGGAPGALVVSSGTLDCSTSSTGPEATVSAAVTAGSYWAVFQTNGTAFTSRSIAEEGFASFGFDTIDGAPRLGLDFTRAWAALPATLDGTAWTVLATSGVPHGFRFRLTI